MSKPEEFQACERPPLIRAQSLPTSLTSSCVPSSASRNRIPADPSTIDLAACIEQCWTALKRQRVSFQHERVAFAEQRRLWDTQKTIMSARIAELERQVSKMSQAAEGGPRSNQFEQQTRKNRSRSAPVWEGSRPAAPPTRVFPKDTANRVGVPGPPARYDRSCLPSLDKALCPSLCAEPVEPMSIPIELIDSTLDGITLKSTGLPPALVARLTPLLKSARTSPDKQTKNENGSGQSSQEPSTHAHQQDQDRKENDKPPQGPNTDPSIVNGEGAGHELTAITTSSSGESSSSREPDNLNEEVQLAPQHTLEQTQKSEDHLPQIDEDPELQGPLSLQNNPSFDERFLQELDLKLRNAAQRPRLGSLSSVFSDLDYDSDGVHGIRFRRNTTNFGTAFGCLGVRDIGP